MTKNLILYFLFFSTICLAQDTKSKYCTPRIPAQSPMKLFSFTLEQVMPYEILSDTIGVYPAEKMTVVNKSYRAGATIPVVVKPSMVFTLGGYVSSTYYQTTNRLYNALNQTLFYNGLTSMAFNYGLFKPINKKLFIINQSLLEFNRDFYLPVFDENMKFSTVVLFGWKGHTRKMFAIGGSRGYKGGSMNYMPFILYNYTFPNNKLGFDVLLPIRASVRYSFSSKNILAFGFEVEGTSYHLQNMQRVRMYNIKNPNLELRRSELRLRFNYDFSLYKYIWAGVQAGYRINNSFNVDAGDPYRGFISKLPYVMENKQTPSLYFNVSLNLVAP